MNTWELGLFFFILFRSFLPFRLNFVEGKQHEQSDE